VLFRAVPSQSMDMKTALNTEQFGLALYEVVGKFHKYLDFIVGFGREYGREPELIYSPITTMYLSPCLSIEAGNLGPSVTSCQDAQTWRQIEYIPGKQVLVRS
jgi:hypothetical protein